MIPSRTHPRSVSEVVDVDMEFVPRRPLISSIEQILDKIRSDLATNTCLLSASNIVISMQQYDIPVMSAILFFDGKTSGSILILIRANQLSSRLLVKPR